LVEQRRLNEVSTAPTALNDHHGYGA
jgi:hypothetical protein